MSLFLEKLIEFSIMNQEHIENFQNEFKDEISGENEDFIFFDIDLSKVFTSAEKSLIRLSGKNYEHYRSYDFFEYIQDIIKEKGAYALFLFEDFNVKSEGHNKKNKATLKELHKKWFIHFGGTSLDTAIGRFFLVLVSVKKDISTLNKRELLYLVSYYFPDKIIKDRYLDLGFRHSCDVCGSFEEIVFDLLSEEFLMNEEEKCKYPDGHKEYKEFIEIKSGKMVISGNFSSDFNIKYVNAARENDSEDIFYDNSEKLELKAFLSVSDKYKFRNQSQRIYIGEKFQKINMIACFEPNNDYFDFNNPRNVNEVENKKISYFKDKHEYIYMDSEDFYSFFEKFFMNPKDFLCEEIELDNGVYEVTKKEDSYNNILDFKKI